MGPALKRATELFLLRAGPAHVTRVMTRGRVLVLAYHNIVPRGAAVHGDRSLHLSQEVFARQLDLLVRTHDVVPLMTLLDPPVRRGRPRAVITFDDAYAGAVGVGVDELVARDLPATIFVAPAFLEGRAFWWDAFADPRTGIVPDELRHRALDELRGSDAAIRTWAESASHAAATPPEHATGASEQALRRAASAPGITLASHTWSHPNLVRLSPDELRDELARPRQWLEARFDAPLAWLSYPYGLSSPAVERAAREAGYVAALRVTGGWMPDRVRSPYALPRLNVPAGLSDRGFALRLAGLVPG